MERKNKNLKLKKFKIIKNINLDKMFKYYKNIFYSDKLYYTENEILNKVVELIEKKSAPSERTMPKYNLIKLSL